MLKIEQFITWLNDEIQELKSGMDHNDIQKGKHSEAIRIRQKLCEIDKTPEIDEESEYLKGQICDRYCRFPEAYDEEDRMHVEKCEGCPLNRLVSE